MTEISMARACSLLIEALRAQNVESDALSHRVRDGLRLLNEASDGYAFAILDQQEHTRRTREKDELKRLRRIVREDYESQPGTKLRHGQLTPNEDD